MPRSTLVTQAKSMASVAASTPRITFLDLRRMIDSEEDSWSCGRIARYFMLADDERQRRRESGIRVPESQRNWAWKGKRAKKMEKLVDSIVHGYPIPSSIVNEVNRNGIMDYEVYDGRHRFETIAKFVNNEFTYRGTLYKDLPPEVQQKFVKRKLPVTIAKDVSPNQLAEMFIRLNSGASLTDSDMFWAYRDSPLVSATRRLICNNERLKDIFGGIDLNNRGDLANWVAHVHGLSTGNAGNMTTSYFRIATEDDSGLLGLYRAVDEAAVQRGIDAMIRLYDLANVQYPILPGSLRAYKKIGKINAFFLADWMDASPNQKEMIIQKWLEVISRLRGDEDEAARMNTTLQVTGAQNLTADKIAKVLDKVTRFLDEEFEDDSDEFSDDDESDM